MANETGNPYMSGSDYLGVLGNVASSIWGGKYAAKQAEAESAAAAAQAQSAIAAAAQAQQERAKQMTILGVVAAVVAAIVIIRTSKRR